MSLEHDLRRTLERRPAPAGFADRVLARVREDGVVHVATRPPRRPRTGWLAATAAGVLVVIGGAQYYMHRQAAAEAERVQRDVRLALQITGEKIALLQRKLQEPSR